MSGSGAGAPINVPPSMIKKSFDEANKETNQSSRQKRQAPKESIGKYMMRMEIERPEKIILFVPEFGLFVGSGSKRDMLKFLDKSRSEDPGCVYVLHAFGVEIASRTRTPHHESVEWRRKKRGWSVWRTK